MLLKIHVKEVKGLNSPIRAGLPGGRGGEDHSHQSDY